MKRRIVFATTGSLGDVHPFLAIGRELKRRGFTVAVATTNRHRDTVEAAGLDFRPMRPDPSDAPDFGRRFMHVRGARFVFAEYLVPAIAESYADLLAACKDADLLISQSLALAAPIVADTTGIAWRSAVFQPMTLSSAYDPPVLPPLPFRPGRPEWNRMLWLWAHRWTRRWFAPVFSFRHRLGLAEGAHPMFEGQHAPDGVLALFSPLLGGPQSDWPPNTFQPGDAVFPDAFPPLPEALQTFLEKGDAPLVFTLGSSSSQSPDDFFAVSREAARRLGKRALLLTGRPADGRVEGDVATYGVLPYERIFPQAEAIVHAAGIGTGMIALRAAAPQLLVPFSHDQHDNAARLARLGQARVLPRRRYRTAAVVTALQALLDGRDAARLSELADAADDGGANRAADWIEAVIPQSGPA